MVSTGLHDTVVAVNPAIGIKMSYVSPWLVDFSSKSCWLSHQMDSQDVPPVSRCAGLAKVLHIRSENTCLLSYSGDVHSF